MTAPTLFPEPEPQRDPTFELRPPVVPRHDGPGLTAADQKRLGTLQGRVYAYMADGEWRTLRELADACGGSEASVSARWRDMAKAPFQRAFGVVEREKRRRSPGVYEYRVVPS